jgi:hypothetical protein
LEKRLKEQEQLHSLAGKVDDHSPDVRPDVAASATNIDTIHPQPTVPCVEHESAKISSTSMSQTSTIAHEAQAVMVDTDDSKDPIMEEILQAYFERLHGQPYHILDEHMTWKSWREKRLPGYLLNAVYAATVRYAEHVCDPCDEPVSSSREHSGRARSDIDVDEPSISRLQALLLLAMACSQDGKTTKSRMLLSHAINMATALRLHVELPHHVRIASRDREERRQLFWACYLMDRFAIWDSNTSPSISDESVHLRLPSWLPTASPDPVDDNFYPNTTALPHTAGVFKASQGSGSMIIGIVRILGIAGRYMAAGGPKQDSHFPWHVQSMFSKICSELDHWATSTRNMFDSLEFPPSQPERSNRVLGQLTYHFIYCLLFRSFLPVDLGDFVGSGQQRSWQTTAIALCFVHANAIAEIAVIGNAIPAVDWTPFICCCVFVAGTVHIHGANHTSLYKDLLFSGSSEYLSREMQQLHDHQSIWAGAQNPMDLLQKINDSHCRLVKFLAYQPMLRSHKSYMDDFFARYRGFRTDYAHIPLPDLTIGTFESGVRDPQTSQSPYGGVFGHSRNKPHDQEAGLSLIRCMEQHTVPKSTSRPDGMIMPTSVAYPPAPGIEEPSTETLEDLQFRCIRVPAANSPQQQKIALCKRRQPLGPCDSLVGDTQISQTDHGQIEALMQDWSSPISNLDLVSARQDRDTIRNVDDMNTSGRSKYLDAGDDHWLSTLESFMGNNVISEADIKHAENVFA